MGIFAFQGFVVATLLAILAGMLIISDHPAAFAVMSICLAANIVVLLLRLFYPPWHYNIYILAAAWFAIAITLGAVVAQAVFRRWPRHLPPDSRRDPAVSTHRSRLWGAVHIDRLVGSPMRSRE